MKLSLIEFVEKTIDLYEEKRPLYHQAEKQIRHRFQALFWNETETVVEIISRIKTADSLKEKLVRNKFYLDFSGPEEALDNLHDLIGLNIECRFIADEDRVYQMIRTRFHESDEGFYQSNDDENLYLDLSTHQPQLQRNGFTIYRIDGHYYSENEKINFELQIKSLTHNFWSEIEHTVVYKNTNFIAFDGFMKKMLGTIRDSLDVVDQQLEIVYDQILDDNSTSFSSDPVSFKHFLSKEINDLVMGMLRAELGFNINFTKSASVLSQYIYVNDLVTNEHVEYRILEYVQQLDYLNTIGISYTETIKPELDYDDDQFTRIVGHYIESVMNVDFDWHVFMVMLYAIDLKQKNSLASFIKTMKKLILQDGWFNTQFNKYDPTEKHLVKNNLMEVIAHCMVNKGKISIIHEDTLYNIMVMLKQFIMKLDEQYATFEDYEKDKAFIEEVLGRKTLSILR